MFKIKVDMYKDKFQKFYYIVVQGEFGPYNNDEWTATDLGIDVKKYTKILRKYGAFNKRQFGYCFHKEEDAQLAIMALEPFVVMKTLTEE